MQAPGEDKPYDDINITPMLDLAYVLLVIFILMCTATVQGSRVNIPKASNAPPPKDKKLKTQSILISDEGKIKLGKDDVSLKDLEQRLTQVKAQDPTTPVVIRGDSKTHYQAVMEVVDIVSRLGFTQVGMATKPRS